MLSKRKSSIIVLVSFLLNFCIGIPSLAQSSDVVGHWAEKEISTWQSKGLAKGYVNGSFKPDNNISRAEFIVMVNKAFGYSAKAQVSYKDVAEGAWYEDEVAKAKAAGYIEGYSDGTMRPDNRISRQESAVMIARILRLADGTGNLAVKFKDGAGIEGWSKDAVYAVVNTKYMSGYKDGTFKAQRPITRAEVVILLNKAVGVLYNDSGTYGPAQGQTDINGNVTISSPDVIFQNTVINGNLYLTEGIGEGNVELKNVTVKGRTLIKGGGVNSIIADNSSLGNVEIAKPSGPVRLAATGSTTVAQITVNSAAKLDSTGATGSAFGNVVISQVSTGDAVTLNGTFGNVLVSTPGVRVDVAGGKVANLQVSDQGANVTLNIASGAAVTNLTVDSAAKVTGTGVIGTAKVNAPGTIIEQTPGSTVVAENTLATVGGKPVAGSPAPTGGVVSGGGGGGGGGGGSGGDSAPSDNLPPTNAETYPKLGTKTDTTANVLVKTNENGKAYFVVLSCGVAAPTAAQVKAGTDAVGGALVATMKGSINLTANTEGTITITGLASGTAHDVYIVCEDAVPNLQAGPVKVTITTDDTVPPVNAETYPKAGANTDTTANVLVKINENGKVYFVVLSGGATAPTAAQVKAGTDAGNAALAANMKGNINLTAAAEGTISITGLAPATAYDTYVVCDDVYNNLQNAPTKVTIVSDPLPPLLQSAETDVTGTKVTLVFDKAMADPVGKQSLFRVLANGVEQYVYAAALNSDPTKIELNIESPIVHEETVTSSFYGGAVEAADGAVLQTFSNQAVTNNVLEAEPVVLMNIKKIGAGVATRQIYVAKFDRTTTYYEITEGTKIDGINIDTDAYYQANEYADSDGPRILTGNIELVAGSIVKLYFNQDGTVNQIRTFGSELQSGSSFTVNQNNSTFAVGGGNSFSVNNNTKIMKVIQTVNNIPGDNIATEVGIYVYSEIAEFNYWIHVRLINGTYNNEVVVIQKNGTAMYILLPDPNTLVPTRDNYGILIGTETREDGEYSDFGGALFPYNARGTVNGAQRGNVVRFTLGMNSIIDFGTVLSANSYSVAGVIYNYFRIKSIDKANKRVEVIAVDGPSVLATDKGTAFWIDVYEGTCFADIEDISNIQLISLDDLSNGDIIQIYDVHDSNSWGPEDGPAFDAGELIYDFVTRVDK